ncbi:MAG: FHA domain-containing protein, partial [Myxococcaceae bacterium]
MPELVFFRRGEEVLRVQVGDDRLVLGRGDKCDVAIPDPEVSRQQVALKFDGKELQLEDLSGKGTLLSGKPVTNAVVPDGGDLTLGQWRAIFRASSGDGASDATQVGDGNTQIAPKDPNAQKWQPAQVRIKQGSNETVHKLAGDSFTAGKDPACDLVIQDRFISSRHLRVTRHEGAFHVVDTNSTNGTFIGPLRIHEVTVPLFTTLRVGEAELVLEPAASSKKDGGGAYQGIIGSDPSV